MTGLSLATRRALLDGCRAVPLLPEVRGARQHQAWRAARQRYLGASEIASALGLPGAYSSPFALWWAKQDDAELPAEVDDEAMEWGRRLEPVIAARFAEDHPGLHVFRPPAGLWRHPDLPFLVATPDRLTRDRSAPYGLAPLETKTDENPGRWTADEYPDIYRYQVLGQCAVFGVTAGWLAALVHKRYRCYRVEFTEAEIGDTLTALEAFWSSLADEPPDVDAHPATRETLSTTAVELGRTAVVGGELVARFRAAHRAYAAAAEAKAAVNNEMRRAMGSAQWAVDSDGAPVATRSVFTHPGLTVGPHRQDKILMREG